MMRLWRARGVLSPLVLMGALAIIPMTIGCAGYAEPRGFLSVTPSSVSIISSVGSSASQTVSVSNGGRATINITQASITGAGFSTQGLSLPATVAPGQSFSFAVKFVPASSKSVDGMLMLMTDFQLRPIMAHLHGSTGAASPVSPTVSEVVVSPASAVAAASGTVQFTSTVEGTTSDHEVVWTATNGTVTSTGRYSAPATAGTVYVTATSLADPSKSATAAVTVTSSSKPAPAPGPTVTAVTISPTAVKAAAHGVVTFNASVAGTTSDKAVVYKAMLGTITTNGVYTAPAKAGTDVVTATSAADNTKSSSATVTVAATNPTPTPTPTPVVTSISVSPISTSAKTGGTLQFTATVQGTVTDKSVSWRTALGSISASGLYTAPAKAGTDTVVATSNADSSMSTTATVSITATPAPTPTVSSISVSPASTSAKTGGSLQFAASVQGTVTDKSVTWKASLGSINSSGGYIAPSKAGTDTVTATSNADASKTATSTVTVTAAAAAPTPTVTSISVSPASTLATTGGTLQFTATVQGTVTDKTVTWNAALGNISASGVYTAPAKAGTDTITATSDADSSKSASATVSVTAPAAPAQPAANTVSLSSYGSVGFGGDDTGVFQTALNSTASNGEVLEIPAGSYNISPINFPSNANVKVDAGVTVSANAGFGSSDRMLNINSKNVTITGAGGTQSVFQMPKARAASQADGSQYRHCLSIQNASNVTVTGIGCNQSGGDGVYVSAATTVTISNCIFDSNFRDGGSIIGQLNHINITNNVFSNTKGSLPQAGVDIEPNVPTDYLTDVNLTDNTMNNNAGDGLAISLWTLTSASQAVSLTITRNHSDSNGRYGYYANNNDPSNAPGTITLNDCTTDQSASDGANARFYAANGASVTFNNLTVTNPHRNGPDPSYGDSAAVAVIRGGGGTVAEGNVHYVGTNVSVTNGQVNYYFDFEDNSNVGISNVTFTPGVLSGATQAVNGILNGQSTNSVN